MGKPPHRPDTSDPVLHDMIERYVRAALKETGTASPPPRERMARGSDAPVPVPRGTEPAPLIRFVEPALPPPDLAAQAAAELARELEAAMSIATPSEFVDETPTDLGAPPVHVPGDEEATGVYARRPD